jgi:hypothetical protein
MWLSFDIMLVSYVLSSCLLNELYHLSVHGAQTLWKPGVVEQKKTEHCHHLKNES